MFQKVLRAESASFMWVLGGVFALFAGSQISLQWAPVPFSFQTCVVLVIGLSYSSRRALATLLAWIGMGAMGLPVFAGYAGGLPCLFGPTGGYLMGMVAAPYVMAWLREAFSLDTLTSHVALCLVGLVVVFSWGCLWLSSFVRWPVAIQVGVMPFLLGDVVKIGLACGAVRWGRHRLWL
ncbi:biotin transporter BioY [Candidatus Hepatobacter penaei]|uniref:biotin transporter BioY n=1 Tax=Candidatus Hepatobacter penaei TaxID=1274402 RepID=UPI0009E3E0A0|nr:biotin transporter BioY [Candidatus Hepatobacter penaei]